MAFIYFLITLIMEFSILLNGSNEFYPKLNNKTYKIVKVDNETKANFMGKIFNDFIQNQNKNLNEKHYIGIDFEFNKISKTDRDVALMQINLENDSNIGYIFILYPPKLSKTNLKQLIDLLTTKQIIKILHGAESLDIPYLFNQLLITKDNIDGFCKNFYDTKYLCDYKSIKDNISGKCSIYQLLLNEKIITNKKLNELEKIEEVIGPLYLIEIDIYNLNNDVLLYSLYDVLFLPELIKKFLTYPNNSIVYTQLIPELSCLINKYKRNIETDFEKMEKKINSMNIYFIKNTTQRILLKEIWEIYYWVFADKDIYMDYLKQINYFKHFFEIVTKFIIYYNLINYFQVYKNKTEHLNNDYLKYSYYLNWLIKYPYLNKILNEYNLLVSMEFKKMVKSLNKKN